MQMRSGRAPGTTHFADFPLTQHDVTQFDIALRQMSVSREEPVAVIDFNHITILRVKIRIGDHAACRCTRRCAGFSHKSIPS